jgi:hypothetical protein
VLAKQATGTRDVELDHAMHHGLAVAQVQGVEDQAPFWRKRNPPEGTAARLSKVSRIRHGVSLKSVGISIELL